MNNIIKTMITSATMCALLASCSTPSLYYQAKSHIQTAQDKIEAKQQQINRQAKPVSSVMIKQGMYVGQQVIDLAHQPKWLNKKITLIGRKLPFSFYSRNIAQQAGAVTHYQFGLRQEFIVNMHYSGTIRGALNVLAAKTGYIYQVNGSNVYWKAYVTKTFNIAYIPGSSNYMVGKEKGSGNSGGSASGGESTVVKQGNPSGMQSQFSNLSARLSVWDDLAKGIKSLLSKDGTVTVSESTTTITVTDHPANVKAVSQYVDEINKQLSKQVMVKVQVLSIDLNKNFQHGINWALAAHAVGSADFHISGDFSNPLAIIPNAGSNAISQIGFGSDSSKALINALDQQGGVSVETEPTIVTTNNQVAALNITTQTGYLAKIQTTTGSGSDNVSTSLTPGQVNAGLTLYVLPKILDRKIYLQVSSDISTLTQIKSLYSKGDEHSDKTNIERIQAPDIADKEFNQRAIISSGATLILAGFKQLKNQTNQDKFLESKTLGGSGSSVQNRETIILITPYIINNG